MSPSIKLCFVYNNKHIDRYQLSFQNERYNIESDTIKIDIPKSLFKYGKDKIKMKITLFEKNSEKKKDFNFNVYYGNNCAYVNISGLYSKTYEIILKSIENLNISGNDIEFTELDTMNNKDRKRLVLINWDSTYLKINEKEIDLRDITEINCVKVYSSYQISEINYNDNKFIVKPFEEKKEYDFSLLIENKDKYKKFVNKLDNLSNIEDIDEYKKKIIELSENNKDLPQYDFIYFNKTTEYLNKIFDNKELDYIGIFFDYFTYLFFYGNIDLFLNKRTVPICFINNIKLKSEEIKEQPDICMNEKIRALNALFLSNGKLETMEDLNNLNIQIYYNTENSLNQYSILGRAINFINNYIIGINSNSVVYENLLYLDGGYGYYNKEKVYTYDLTNLKMLKLHLKQLIPKIIIFCYAENTEMAFTAPEFNGIVINDYFLAPKFVKKIGSLKIDYNKPPTYFKELTEDDMNDIALDIALELIHEIMGHKKNALVEPGMESPKKIVNKDELIELKCVSDFFKDRLNNIIDKCEYILTTKKGKGDSGHFLELSYGKIDNTLITKLLFDMDNKGKLIERPDLFTDKGEILKKYVSLRTIIKKRNIKFNLNNDLSIEREIEEMNKLIINSDNPDNNKNLAENKKIEDNKVIENKKDFLSKKRNNESAIAINKLKSDKKANLSMLKTDDKQFEIKKEDEKVENKDKEEQDEDELPFYERYIKKSREQIVEECRKRVFKKFKFKFDDNLRYNMIQKLKEIDKNNPYYYDLSILIEDSRRIV